MTEKKQREPLNDYFRDDAAIRDFTCDRSGMRIMRTPIVKVEPLWMKLNRLL